MSDDWLISEYDNGEKLLLSSYAGGGSKGGYMSEVTFMRELSDGTVQFRKYVPAEDWRESDLKCGGPK